MDSRWQEKQMQVGRSLVEQGSQALRQNDFNTANAALNEASAILDMVEEETDEVLKMRAQVLNETGFILQRSNKTDEAIRNHQKAVELCDSLLERGIEFRANAAATNINLAGLLAGKGEFEAARAANLQAIQLAESMLEDGKDPDHAGNLCFGANQNYAMILAKSGEWEEAQAALGRAMELVDSLVAKNRGVHAQAAQGCQQMSVLLFHEQKFDEALRWGRHAEELSEKAYQAIGEPVLPVYVTSQINLISYYEKAGQFADAEDCLFKALEVVGSHPQILLRGKAFYEECRTQADNRLESGNLPREEVEDGYKEIINRIEEAGGLEELQAEVEKNQAAQRQGQGQQGQGQPSQAPKTQAEDT